MAKAAKAKDLWREPSHKEQADYHIEEVVKHAVLEHPQTKRLMKQIRKDMAKASQGARTIKK